MLLKVTIASVRPMYIGLNDAIGSRSSGHQKDRQTTILTFLLDYAKRNEDKSFY